MSNASDLKLSLIITTRRYIQSAGIQESEYTVRQSAIVFSDVTRNFQPEAYRNIQGREWANRLAKNHSHFDDGTKEMASSNSSDAVLMNVFCHPKIKVWKGVAQLTGINPDDIEFGWNPGIETHDSPTEIDMYSNNTIYEAKLTEKGFTEKNIGKVREVYPDFEDVFESSSLTENGMVKHYQLIRNIIAAKKHDANFRLIIDYRRPDLLRYFLETVASVKSFELRKRCSFLTWQEIAQSTGRDLQEFLRMKYGF